jgi:hypothetical protein
MHTLTWPGLVKAEWAPDGRSVLCFSEWGVSFRSNHLFSYVGIHLNQRTSCV